MSDHVRRIEEVEGKVKQIKEEGASKEDVKKLRQETKKVYVSEKLSARSTASLVSSFEERTFTEQRREGRVEADLDESLLLLFLFLPVLRRTPSA